MDIDSAKENIQPLASGRNVSLLELALNAETQRKVQEELSEKRREFEARIDGYEGDDPLELWFEYIYWIEQTYPRNGRESAFEEALQRCIKTFEHEGKYKQDRRMVKLYIKFIDMQPKQHDYYNFLYNQGIGTMVADLYMCWAYYFEVLDNFARAEEIYQKGISARAEPLEDLKQSHMQFLVMVGERNLYRDEESNSKFLAKMDEKRFALTSLHGQKKRNVVAVGSVRTGVAIKELNPGVVLQENIQETKRQHGNVTVFAGESFMDTVEEPSTSQMKSVVDSAIKANENKREPGPWSSAKKGPQKCSLFPKKDKGNDDIGFDICEDSVDAIRIDESMPESDGIQLPPGFVSKNNPQDEFNVPLIIQEQTAAVPEYLKHFCYPSSRVDQEFSPEEILAYRYWKNQINYQECRVVTEMEEFMDAINLPKYFASKNMCQDIFEPERFPFEAAANQIAMCQILGSNQTVSYEVLMKEKYILKLNQDKIKSARSGNMSLTMVNVVSDDMEIEIEEEEDGARCLPITESIATNQPQTGEDERVIDEVEERPFGLNETCSTQMFNFFIKPQQISTPNMGKKNKQVMPRSSLSLYRGYQPKVDDILECSNEEMQKLSLSDHQKQQHQPIGLLPPHAMTTMTDIAPLNGKQLSVIMETTENSTSSGGGQTNTKSSVDTRFCSTIYQDVTEKRQTIDPVAKASLTAKPRKPILKKPSLSNPTSPTKDPMAIEAVKVYMDDDDEDINKTSLLMQKSSFSVPTTTPASIPIYRDSLDLYNMQQQQTTIPQLQHDFAVPLPPKPRTFMPLYNDSMEQFREKAKQIHVQLPTTAAGTDVMPIEPVHKTLESPVISIYRDSMDASNEKSRKEVVRPDFSIFHDSMMAPSSNEETKPILTRTEWIGPENVDPQIDSPVNSIIGIGTKQKAIARFDSFDFLDSPKQTAAGKSLVTNAVTCSESIMPTFNEIDPHLLEQSVTFPSLREATTTGNAFSKRLMNQTKDKSVAAVHSEEPTVTFTSLINKKERMAAATAEKSCKLSMSIADLRKEDSINPNASIFSIKAMEDEKDNNVNKSMKTETDKRIDEMHNESVTFHTLLKKGGLRNDPNQSSFLNLMTELPSSTTNQYSIFGNKVEPNTNVESSSFHIAPIHMEKSISPIKKTTAAVESNVEMEEEVDNIYRWENTLRVLPEANISGTDSWYNQDLDVTVNFHLDPGHVPKSVASSKTVDPFDNQLINTFLDKVDFVNYLNDVHECDMKEKMPPLKQGTDVQIVDKVFHVRKLVGTGAFGRIYSAKCNDGRLYALKQSKPCNLWEYYICMEVKCRILEFNVDLLPAFIDIEYALVAKNASVFVQPFCKYGNLINVCNEYKKNTNRNLNEKVVMVLAIQLLAMIDALHACQIIHADIKPDNIMLMAPINQLNYDEPVLKLIDFGQSIDMKMFPEKVKFSSALATDGFTCTEMRENRPWTFQTDLYCLAGTIHTLLFGKYMAVRRDMCGYGVTEKYPRYLQKIVWDQVFANLLNVSDCQSMPNLQQLKLVLKEHLSMCENVTHEEIRKFNQIVLQIEVLDK